MPLSPDLNPLFQAAGQQFNVDPTLLKALALTESNGNQNAVSPAGAQGMMQLMPGTAAALGVKDPTDPKQAIPAAAKYLAQGLDKYGNPTDALKFYFGGPNQADWGPKTAAYPATVAGHYQTLLGGGNRGTTSQPPASSVQPAAQSNLSEAEAARETPTKTKGGYVDGTYYPNIDAWNIAMDKQSAQFPANSDSGLHPPAPTQGVSMPAAAPQSSIDAMSDDALLAAFGQAKSGPSSGTPMPTAAAPAPVDPSTMSDDDLLRAFSQKAPATASTPVAAPPVAASEETLAQRLAAQPLPQGMTAANGAGITEGAFIDPALAASRGGQWLAQQFPNIAAVAQKLGIDPAAAVNALTQRRDATQQQYGTDPGFQGGRLVGNALISAPVVGAGGAALKAAGPIGEFLAGAGGNNALTRVLSSATGGALGGSASAAATSGSSDDPAAYIKSGAELGAAGSALLGGAAAVGNRLTAGLMDPETAQLANKAINQYGLGALRTAQVADSPFLAKWDQISGKLPFSGAGQAAGELSSQWNHAVAQTFGEDADRITPAIMNRAKTRLGNVFDGVAANTTIVGDEPLVQDLSQIATDSASLPAAGPTISKQIANVYNQFNGGQMPGSAYQALTRKGTPLDRAMQSQDPNIRFYAGQIRDALDDALQRSAPPDQVQALTQARGQYKAMKTIEDLAEKSPTGNISPALLMNQVRNSYGNTMAYSTNPPPLVDLARIGQKFMKEPADSGTPLGETVLNALTKPGSLAVEGLGALGGAHAAGLLSPGGTVIGGLGLAGSAIANRLTRAAVNSQAYRNMMIRNALTGNTGPVSQQLRLLAPYAGSVAAIGGNNLLTGPAQRSQ